MTKFNSGKLFGGLIAFFAVNGAMATAFAAFAHHGALSDHSRELINIASGQQAIGAGFGLITMLLIERLGRFALLAAGFTALGLILFPLTVYALALGWINNSIIAPFGGTSFILSWLILAAGGIKYFYER